MTDFKDEYNEEIGHYGQTLIILLTMPVYNQAIKFKV